MQFSNQAEKGPNSMYHQRGIRENNNVLNPQGAPTSIDQNYRPERGGYQNSYNQNTTSVVSNLLYGGNEGQPTNAQYKPSIQISNGQKHHHSSNIAMAHEAPQASDYGQNLNQLPNKQGVSDIQLRIIEQNRQQDLLLSQKQNFQSNTKSPVYEQIPPKNDYNDLTIGQQISSGPIQAPQGGARNLSQKRRDGSQNLRNVGQQSLRDSSNNGGRPRGVEKDPLPQTNNVMKKSQLTEENVFNLASKPPNPLRSSYELEPIENYKGKSIAELEAILDSHNAHNAAKKPDVTQIQDNAVQNQPNVNNEKRQSRYGSQKRNVSKGKQEETKLPERIRGGAKDLGPRPPLAPKQANDQQEQRKGYGKVPKYLQKFNQEKADKQYQKDLDAENAKCPPGTRKMEESERQDMLKDLKQTKYKLEDEIGKFPITMKTMAIQKRRTEAEQQLDKVEKNIQLFSKDVVYIGI